MAAAAERFVCQECGASASKWAGRCDSCGAWNTIVEETPVDAPPRGLSAGKGRAIALAALDGAAEDGPRESTGIAEFDRVCGGGLVPGSAILIGGDPGIGKSTLVIQVLAALARQDLGCVYVSGEEAVDQVRGRARRLGIAEAPVKLATATNVRDILTTLEGNAGLRAFAIDSIQTQFVDSIGSAPGTVAQVRASAQALIGFAKRGRATALLTGHVTKEGMIAGPRVLEHMVDTVLYFEGERGHQFRILRAVKNRFGPTDEIGVFEMTDAGLTEVPNPSALFLTSREAPVSGAAVFAGIEGTRPVLVEIQALVAPSPLGTPRRAVVGWDSARLAMVLAVLEARCGVSLGGNDIYLSVAGGLRVSEPAADLAVAAALISARNGVPVPESALTFGEIGLSGEVRPVGQRELRLKEAAKLGFARAFTPPAAGRRRTPLAVTEIAHLEELVRVFDDGPRGAVVGKG